MSALLPTEVLRYSCNKYFIEGGMLDYESVATTLSNPLQNRHPLALGSLSQAMSDLLASAYLAWS
jgi:hypothetical protein